jgi:hypothetical protein
LREIHNIEALVLKPSGYSAVIYYRRKQTPKNKCFPTFANATYEESLELVLFEALKLIKND